jgi:hypothetical protein
MACRTDFEEKLKEGIDIKTGKRCGEAWDKVRDVQGVLLAEIEQALAESPVSSGDRAQIPALRAIKSKPGG